MKKAVAFIGAFSLSVIIFASVIAVSLIVPDLENLLSSDTSSSQNSSVAEQSETPREALLCIFEEGDKFYASVLMLDIDSAKCGFKNIDLLETPGNKTYLQIYKTEGLYPFASAVMGKSYGDEPTFVKFNAETFAKTTDRFEKIVYNSEQDGEFLLTGSQAAEKLTAENFGFFCSILAEQMIKTGSVSDFLFICNTLENNISVKEISKLTK